jgi:hypothetical protein
MRKLAALFASTAMLLALAGPASASPPDRFEAAIWTIFPDTENQLVVFWNMTRDDYCAWEATDFDGEPPVGGLISGRNHVTGSGAVMERWSGSAPFELWTLDEDAPLTGPCEDTDDSTAPWATGSGIASSRDNDLAHDVSIEMGLHRTNTFGNRGKATVEAVDGHTYQYDWNVHYHIDKHGEFSIIFEKQGLKLIG